MHIVVLDHVLQQILFPRKDAARKFNNMKDRWRRLKKTQEAAQTPGKVRGRAQNYLAVLQNYG